MRAARPFSLATVAVLLLMHSTVASAHAECIGIGPREMSRLSAVVLEGTVRQIVQPYPAIAELTVDVHRVWKGAVSREAVFFLERQNIDATKGKGRRPTRVLCRTGERFARRIASDVFVFVWRC